MKQILFLFSVLAVVGITEVQAQSTLRATVNSGATIPTGDAGDFFNTGFNLGGGLELGFAPRFAAQATVGYHNINLDHAAVLQGLGLSGSGIGLTGGRASEVMVMANLKMHVPVEGSSATPYLLGGVGIGRTAVSDFTVSFEGESVTFGSESDVDAALNFGAGIDFSLSDTVSLFGQAIYGVVFTDENWTTLIPLQIGLSFAPR